MPPSQSTPLLRQPSYTASSPAPLPWPLLLPILLLRMADAATYMLIFPFITSYITSLHPPPTLIGFYTGLAEGCLMAVEAVCAVGWGWAGDRWGRKKCLVWGVAVAGTFGAVAGFGKSVGWVIFWRAMYGFTPTGVLTKTVVVEIAHPTNRARIFSIYSPAFSVGIIIGSLLGGELAGPARRVGQDWAWLQVYPDALAGDREWGFVSAKFGERRRLIGDRTMVVCVVAWSMLEEVSFRAAGVIEHSRKCQTKKDHGKDDEDETPVNKYKAIWRVPHFVHAVTIFCCNKSTHNLAGTFAFEGLFTIYTYTPIPLGGLGLPIRTIGLISSLSSLLYILVSPVLSPWLEARYGLKKSMLLTTGTMPLEALIVPVAQYAATLCLPGRGRGGGWGRAPTWVMLVIQVGMKNFHCMAWPQNDHLIYSVLDGYPRLVGSASAVVLIAGSRSQASASRCICQ
ncbi:hypothetical protein L202_01981 [Cryptococcus amylolentus CBS 6039]|uniref:Major facilitator superfamily (MFS) profile domain-containing protein n=1 Tax=Cryptococcus amylolentus CBS 6039 TaxID=1295533 RepID=A0A1E3I0P9_9TREE|nr:hypothetical protein L202_01981 [Cryptococcus amylolentus CBS 6039]ODN81566.1 hypothetical protein L202_01981 [Cryptococcus amylolentus CBS 6039]